MQTRFEEIELRQETGGEAWVVVENIAKAIKYKIDDR